MISAAIFDSSGTNTVAYSTIPVLAGGFLINTQLPAQYYNSMQNVWSVASMEIQNVVTNTLTPGTMANVGTPGGTAGLVATDYTQLLKSVIAVSHYVGENIESEVALTPVAWTAATFSSVATQYRPIVSRQADITVTTTNYPDLVPALRAEQTTMNITGTGINSWAVTNTGGVLTNNGTLAQFQALVTMLNAEFLANGFMATQPAAPSNLYTYVAGAVSRTINLGGTDYSITSVNTATPSITIASPPVNGTYTLTMYPYRIAGSTTSAFLPRLSGFVGVAQYDYDSEVVAGFRRMDRFESHYHNPLSGASPSYWVGVSSGGLFTGIGGGTITVQQSTTGAPVGDGTNTLRTGKTTDPRTRSVYVYTHVGRLLP